jgi:FAD/FMN-containing dehydrogenase
VSDQASTSTDLVTALRRAVGPDAVLAPGDDGYAEATRPDNSSFPQRPGAVVRVRRPDDLAALVVVARQAGRRVVVQATGHGSGAELGADVVLADTSGLDDVAVDPRARTARVGAGATWSAVQAAAEPHGLLALGGTSPSVGVAGYTVAGGVGWLARPHGLAAGSLRGLSYVDGVGSLHHADDEASDPVAREALWAFRGGAPVGLATELELDLYPRGDLWAGYLLWPAGSLPAVARAWADALGRAPESLTSTLSLLHLPPAGPFPAELLGSVVVHLSYATPGGRADLVAMREAVRAAADPVVDTTGPADAATLAGIHLDPPAGVPARGDGWWLDGSAPDLVEPVFVAARVGEPDGLAMVELRHVASAAPAREGAMNHVPAPFLLHAVGAGPDDAARARIDHTLADVADTAAPALIGRSASSFREGQPDPGAGHPTDTRARLEAVAGALDPYAVLYFQRGRQR